MSLYDDEDILKIGPRDKKVPPNIKLLDCS